VLQITSSMMAAASRPAQSAGDPAWAWATGAAKFDGANFVRGQPPPSGAGPLCGAGRRVRSAVWGRMGWIEDALGPIIDDRVTSGATSKGRRSSGEFQGKSSPLTSAIPSNVSIGATGCRVGGSAIRRESNLSGARIKPRTSPGGTGIGATRSTRKGRGQPKLWKLGTGRVTAVRFNIIGQTVGLGLRKTQLSGSATVFGWPSPAGTT
jgi:hypothetical protein